MSSFLLLDFIPDLVEILILSIAMLAAGGVAGFLVFRIKNKKDLGIFEARETALANKEKDLIRIRASIQERHHQNDEVHEAAVSLLKEEIEQMELDVSILKEEHALEIKVLQDALNAVRNGSGMDSGFAYEIEDVAFKSETEDPAEAVDQTEPVMSPEQDAKNVEARLDEENALAEESMPADDAAEKEASLTNWASNLVSNMISEVVASFSNVETTSSRAAASDSPEPRPETDTRLSPGAEEPGDVSIPAFPKFESLTQLFNLDPYTSEYDGTTDNAEAREAGLQMLVSLPDPEFQRLVDMGFGSYERIAQLTSSEIATLSDQFHVPETTIAQIWISAAQLRLFEGADKR